MDVVTEAAIMLVSFLILCIFIVGLFCLIVFLVFGMLDIVLLYSYFFFSYASITLFCFSPESCFCLDSVLAYSKIVALSLQRQLIGGTYDVRN